MTTSKKRAVLLTFFSPAPAIAYPSSPRPWSSCPSSSPVEIRQNTDPLRPVSRAIDSRSLRDRNRTPPRPAVALLDAKPTRALPIEHIAVTVLRLALRVDSERSERIERLDIVLVIIRVFRRLGDIVARARVVVVAVLIRLHQLAVGADVPADDGRTRRRRSGVRQPTLQDD